MKLACPSCGAMVPIQRAKIVRVLAHCPVCKSVVEFEQTLGAVTITIARGLNSPNQAQFIERSIELYAGIEDHPMPNEAPK
ncbi:MAG: hypothetical protein JNK05_38965 [Myxococcales bacterium]|nr:hypothetical protein [Myxococcales bacterium]